jgi:hypothetical protein
VLRFPHWSRQTGRVSSSSQQNRNSWRQLPSSSRTSSQQQLHPHSQKNHNISTHSDQDSTTRWVNKSDLAS